MAGPAGAPTPWLRGPEDEGRGAQDEAWQGGRREENSRKKQETEEPPSFSPANTAETAVAPDPQ